MKYILILFFICLSVLQAEVKESIQSLEKVSLQLKWFHQFQFAGYYAAKEKGYYKDVGLDVEIKERKIQHDNVEQVIKGESQYGIADSELMVYRSRQEPVVLVSAILQHSPIVLVTLKKSNIENPYQLKNKEILFYKNKVDGISITSMFAALNIDVSKKKSRINIGYQALVEKKVDAFVGYITNEVFSLQQENIPINIINPANYGFDFYGDMLFTNEFEAQNHPHRVKNFKEATLKGWKYALNNKEEIISLIKNKYAQNKSVEHLRYEADALEQLIQHKTIALGTIDKGRVSYISSIYKKYGLIDNNFDLDKYIFQDPIKKEQKMFTEKGSLFSNQELKYLENKKNITMCINPTWMPFEKIQNGKHIGLSADFIELMAKKLKLDITLVPTKDWEESLLFAKERKCDILSLVIATPKRREYLNFSKNYLKVPLVVVSRNENLFVDDVVKIRKKLAIGKGSAHEELLKYKYPDMDIVGVKNVKEGLEKVNNNEVYGYIGTLATTGYEIQKNHTGFLKIIGKFEETMDLGVGIRNDEPILKNIFDKAIGSISIDQQNAIVNKWLLVNYAKEDTIWEILQWISATIILSFFIIYFILKKNKQLSNEIISRKSIEKELEDTLELFNLGETVLFKWKNDGKWSIAYTSENTIQLLGYSKDDFMTHKVEYTDLVHEDDLIEGLEEINKNMENELFSHKPYRIKKYSGEYIWVSETSKIIRNEKREVTYLLGFVRDITMEIKQKNDLKNTHLSLLKSEKLAALGQLLANIAHEINSPLGAIKSSVELASSELSYFISNYAGVLESLSKDELTIFNYIVENIIQNNTFISSSHERVLKKSIEKFLKEKELDKARIIADKLARLKIFEVDEIEKIFSLLLHDNQEEILKILLIISKLYASNANIKEAINSATKTILALKTYAHTVEDSSFTSLKTLKESMDTVLTLYSSKLKYNVNLVYDTQELEPLMANHDELMQVWTNIIHNALHAMDNNGDLSIKIYQQNNTQVVEITDSGTGMSDEIKEKIFEPFFTTKPTGVGSGLGLDIIQKIIKKLNGTIEVESEVGVGSTFKVILPF